MTGTICITHSSSVHSHEPSVCRRSRRTIGLIRSQTTHMLCSFASFIYDLSYSFTQCNLNSNSLKKPVSHDSRTDEPCFAASAFASHTELICRTFQKTRTSSGSLNRAGLRSQRSDFTPNATLRQMENVDTLFGHYTVHILYLTSF